MKQSSPKIDDDKPETEEVPEKEDLEPNNLQMSDDQMEVEELPKDKNSEQVSPCLLYTSRCV